MIIDAHQHIWDPNHAEYSWLTSELSPINRTILFPEFQAKMLARKIDYTVLVQSADNVEDTEVMLDASRKYGAILGVVAYAPLGDPNETQRLIAKYLKDPKIVGIRNLFHTYSDTKWLLREDVNLSLDILEKENLTFDLVSVLPEHLESIPFLSQRHPRLKMVIDHLSKPPIEEGVTSNAGKLWIAQMTFAAQNPNVFAKVSGLYPGVSPMHWNVDSIRPFIDQALEIFGSSRLMYGGDWPISILSGDYERVFDALHKIISELPEVDQRNLFSETAVRFYGLRKVGESEHEN
jgi:L-fuconolactonase